MFIWLGMAGGPAAIMALERGGKAALNVVAREQAAFMIALTLPSAVGLALVAKPLAAVMIGPALRDGAAQVTPWIAASGFFAGVTTYYFHTAFTLGRQTRLLLLAMAIPAATNLALTLILIPRYGLQGAMWATLASYVLGAAASAGLGRFSLPLPLPWRAFAKAGFATAIMGAAVWLVPAIGGPIELFAKAVLGAAVYAALAYLLDICGVRSRGLKTVRRLLARPA
jgi:O-antigen/teichoic acid export membrane protein